MPSQSTTISPLTTFIILCCFTLGFFPATFVSILWSPYNYAFPPAAPRRPSSVVCHLPNICTAPTMSWYDLHYRRDPIPHFSSDVYSCISFLISHPSPPTITRIANISTIQVPENSLPPPALPRLLPHNRPHHQLPPRDFTVQDWSAQPLHPTHILRALPERELGRRRPRRHV